jgi:ATP-dependent DNA helicase PIF1
MSLVLNTKQQAILDFVMANPTRSCLCHGAAGTGKSVIVHTMLANLPHTVVLGPTGKSVMTMSAAATLAKYMGATAQTVGVPSLLVQNPRQPLLTAHTIIIDECGMISAGDFVALDQLLRRQRCAPHVPFGGVRLILVGDVYQLQPVDNFFFMTDSWKLLEVHCPLAVFQLEQNERVLQGDPELYKETLNLLKALRYGTFSPWDHAHGFVNYMLVPRSPPPTRRLDLVVLCATNAVARNINEQYLAECQGQPVSFRSGGTTIEYKIGARVQVTRNIYENSQLIVCNGAMGTIQEMRPFDAQQTVQPINALSKSKRWVCVVLFDEMDETIAITSCKMPQGPTENNNGMDDGRKTASYHFPLRVAYAVTIHCMQGQTLRRGVINGVAMFAGQAQLYTAFSRFSSISELYLQNLDAYHIDTILQKSTPHKALQAFIRRYQLE